MAALPGAGRCCFFSLWMGFETLFVLFVSLSFYLVPYEFDD